MKSSQKNFNFAVFRDMIKAAIEWKTDDYRKGKGYAGEI